MASIVVEINGTPKNVGAELTGTGKYDVQNLHSGPIKSRTYLLADTPTANVPAKVFEPLEWFVLDFADRSTDNIWVWTANGADAEIIAEAQ